MNNQNTNRFLFIYWDYNKRGTWCSQIDTICEKLKIDYVFLNQLSVDIKEIEMKLYEYTQNIGNEGLPAYQTLGTFITFKTNYKLEPILNLNYQKINERTTFAQFRC